MNPKNNCNFIGRLSREPETKTFDGGSSTTFSIAVTRSYKNKDGQYDADFIDCRAYNKLGETIARHFHKGSPIILSGEFKNNNWTDKDGVKHYSSFIQVNEFAFPERDISREANFGGTATTPTEQAAPVDSVPVNADGFLPFS